MYSRRPMTTFTPKIRRRWSSIREALLRRDRVRAGEPGVRDLLLVVPSRERPANIARLAEALKETCRGDTHFLVGLDADDPTLPEYLGPRLRDRVRRGGGSARRRGLGQSPRRAACSRLPFHRDNQRRQRPSHRGMGCSRDRGTVTVYRSASVMTCIPGAPPGSLCCHVFMHAEVVRNARVYGGAQSPAHVCRRCVDGVGAGGRHRVP